MTMISRLRRIGALLLACLLLQPAAALETITKLVPMEGAYVSPDFPNTAFFFEVDEQDYGFVAWYTYDEQGRSTFLTLQGTLTYKTELERRESGVIASMRSPIYTASNGGCPTCTPRPADIQVSTLGEGEMVWSAARRATIRYAGRTVGLQALELTWPENRTIEGLWRLDSRDLDLTAGNPHARARYASAVVRIFRYAGAFPLHAHFAETPGQPAGPVSAYNFGVIPSPNAAYYGLECLSGCINADLYTSNSGDSTATKPSRWTLWFEGGLWRMANTSAVSSPPFATANQLNGGSLVGEMFVGQNQITIRRRSPRVDTFQLPSGEVVLSRLPDNWTRP